VNGFGLTPLLQPKKIYRVRFPELLFIKLFLKIPVLRDGTLSVGLLDLEEH
jgi:hypothetical protein